MCATLLVTLSCVVDCVRSHPAFDQLHQPFWITLLEFNENVGRHSKLDEDNLDRRGQLVHVGDAGLFYIGEHLCESCMYMQQSAHCHAMSQRTRCDCIGQSGLQ